MRRPARDPDEGAGCADVSPVDRAARDQALKALAATPVAVTGLVEYRAGPRLLVIGEDAALVQRAIAASTPLRPSVLLLAPGGRRRRAWQRAPDTPGDGRHAIDGLFWASRDELDLAGWLGAFQLRARDRRRPQAAAAVSLAAFDLVLDIATPPLLERQWHPPGYLCADPDQPEPALEQLRDLVGSFAKPVYVHYDPALCAHGRAGHRACQRCLDACPAQAITSLVEQVRVEPHLCQGGGACATACPTGALTYGYPAAGDSVERIRQMLLAYHRAGGHGAVLIVHDTGAGALGAAGLLAGGPGYSTDPLLPLAVEEVASLGIEVWFAALAYGVGAVRLLDRPGIPAASRAVLDEQLGIARAILAALDYPADAVGWLTTEAVGPDGQVADAPRLRPVMPPFTPATWAGVGDKRQVFFAALDHLVAVREAAPGLAELPPGAPFGAVRVAADACTLCLACVTVCPGKALLAGEERPQLRFREANCIACGLCARVCPEDAIAISPRLLFDRAARNGVRLLHEDQPFHCERCGSAFASSATIGRIHARLADHPRYRTAQSRRRLGMCADCRVLDMMAQGEL